MSRMEISEISIRNGRIEWKSCSQNGNDCNGELQWMTLAGFHNKLTQCNNEQSSYILDWIAHEQRS